MLKSLNVKASLVSVLLLLVLLAAEAVRQGAGHDGVVRLLEEACNRTRILVAVPRVEQMVRSGRLSHARGWVARVLGLAPIITLDQEGRGAAWGRPRRWRSGLDGMVAVAERTHREVGIQRWAVAHAQAPEAAHSFACRVEGQLGFAPDFVTDISPVLGAHAGSGSLALATL
jgi:hypothetical protein